MTDEAWSHLPACAAPQLQLRGAPARHIVVVLQSQQVGLSFHRLRLSSPAIAQGARPGQFVHVLPAALPPAAAHEEDLRGAPAESHDPLLRRAFSIMSSSRVLAGDRGQDGEPQSGEADGGEAEGGEPQGGEAEGGEWFEILFRVGGRGTSLLARSRIGDRLDVLGPLGNGFMPDKTPADTHPADTHPADTHPADTHPAPMHEAGHSQRPLLLVGGGIGVPPLLFAAQQAQADAAQANAARGTGAGGTRARGVVEAFVGARTAAELIGVEALARAGAQVHVATDDGSQGRRGLVTQLLRERLQEMLQQEVLAPDRGSTAATLPQKWQQLPPLVCACGPWPMLKAVARLCASLKVQCRVSLEENMPCGVGVCNGCVVPVLGATDEYGRFQRVCIHGPVLDAQAVDWGDTVPPPAPATPPARPPRSPEGTEHHGDSQ